MTLTTHGVAVHLSDYLGGNYKEQTQREIRRAIQSAYRETAEAHPWSHLMRVWFVTLHDELTGGTLTYDHTGGSSERLWTFSGITLTESWADNAMVRLTVHESDADFPVWRYLTTTTAQAHPSLNPGEDVAAGTSCTVFQDTYTLPVDFMAAGFGMPEVASYSFATSHQSLALLRRQSGTSNSPIAYSVVSDPVLPGRHALKVYQWPSADETFEFLYRSYGRPLKYFGTAVRDSSGTVTTTASNTTIEGSGTAFASDMVGSLIWISANSTDLPTDQDGDNPYVIEGVIEAVTDSDTLIVRANSNTTAYTSVAYRIVDPIDFSPNMLNPFLRCCEKHVEIVRQREGAGKGDAAELYEMALRTAKRADHKSFEPKSLAHSDGYSTAALERERPAGPTTD